MNRPCSLLFGLLILHVAQVAVAETVTVNVSIQSVKPEAKEITVAYKTSTGEKSVTLDVSRKAEITLNGTQATLEALGPGQKGILEYHKTLSIVTRVDAVGTAIGPPRLVHISEIEQPWAFSLTDDGLRIYYERREQGMGTIYMAQRKDAESFFENEVKLFPGFFPTITGDGCEMLLLSVSTHSKAGAFFSTTRENVEESFRRPSMISALHDPGAFSYPTNPFLSHNGLTLHFNRYPKEGKVELACATRPNRSTPWGKPTTVKVNGGDLFGPLTCPFVTDDGLTLLCTVETPEIWARKSNLLKFSRTSLDAPFGNPESVEIKGISKLMARWPRFVSSTQELFLVQYEKELFQKSRLIAVKNFVP